MVGYGGGHPDECRQCGAPPWESCEVYTDVSCPTCGAMLGMPCAGPLGMLCSRRERAAAEAAPRPSTPAPADDHYTHQLSHAGRVRRYHTWAVHHQQTVGEHSWQVARVYTAIFGVPTAEVAHYVAHHDSAELIVGDPPFPVKATTPALKAAYDSLEWIAVQELGLKLPQLDERERRRVKVCDLVEMMEFGMCELEMGNRHAAAIVRNTGAALGTVPIYPEDVRALESYVEVVRARHSRIMSGTEVVGR